MNLSELNTRIENYLLKANLAYEKHPNGTFGVRNGSTKVIIVGQPLGELWIVRLLALVSGDCKKIDTELLLFLATENNKLLFGKFSLDLDNRIVWYEHTLLANDMDQSELIIAVATIAKTADDYDEKICFMTQGKRTIDL